MAAGWLLISVDQRFHGIDSSLSLSWTTKVRLRKRKEGGSGKISNTVRFYGNLRFVLRSTVKRGNELLLVFLGEQDW